MDGRDRVSLREFARRKGVVPNAVSQALKNGRVSREADGKFDWLSQSEAWDARKDHSKDRAYLHEDEADEVDGEPPDGDAKEEFFKAKTRKEIALAGIKEIELGQAKGELIRAAHARAAMVRFASDVRDKVMGIPDRVASELSAEIAKLGPGADADLIRALVHRVWKRESRAALESIGSADS